MHLSPGSDGSCLAVPGPQTVRPWLRGQNAWPLFQNSLLGVLGALSLSSGLSSLCENWWNLEPLILR